MAITNTMCESFIHELLQALHDFSADTFKVALIKGSHSGTYDKEIENYSELGSDEVANGSGYTTGGETLTGVTLTRDDTNSVTYVDFADTVWSSASFSADGAIIYNTSQGNAAVAIIDFVTTQTVSSADFTIAWPAATSANAILRFPLS